MVVTILYLIPLLFILALIFYAIARRRSSVIESARKKYGIQAGEVIYSDLYSDRDRPVKSLLSKRFGISGKPDYIVKDKGRLIPVELKSGRASTPHRGHVLQLAAYCLLIEENYGKAVPHGILVYGDGKQHLIKFDDALRKDLISTVEEMRRCWSEGSPVRNHSSKRKCSSCLLREDCNYCLAKIDES
ncbi:MAG: CRISPR-associated protein Cas4 [Methanotrichaceae archaeon]